MNSVNSGDLVSQADLCGFLGPLIQTLQSERVDGSATVTAVLRLLDEYLLEELRTTAMRVREVEQLAGNLPALQEFRRVEQWRAPYVERLVDALNSGDRPRVRRWHWAGSGYLGAVNAFAIQRRARAQLDERLASFEAASGFGAHATFVAEGMRRRILDAKAHVKRPSRALAQCDRADELGALLQELDACRSARVQLRNQLRAEVKLAQKDMPKRVSALPEPIALEEQIAHYERILEYNAFQNKERSRQALANGVHDAAFLGFAEKPDTGCDRLVYLARFIRRPE